MPSIQQCAQRALSFHRLALAYRSAGRQIWDDYDPSPGELKGMRTAVATLYRWGALDDEGITDRGREILAAIQGDA